MNAKIILLVVLLSLSLLFVSQNVYSATGPWDVNQDGVVDKADLDIVSKNFGSKNASADVNGDGIVNILDLVLISKHFGEKYELSNEIIGKDGAPMVLIPAGEFQMGDAFNEGSSNERPVHTVYLDAFYIDKYEVTNAQYKKFMQATGHKEPEGNIYQENISQMVWSKPLADNRYNGDNQPVICVSWEDAKAYAEWAGKRLPTEAEWEKAARGGLVGKRFPWGDDKQCNANIWGTCVTKPTIIDDLWWHTSPIGSFAPNGYGLYDMTGNVWEWCADWYDGNYYANSPKSNPTGPESGLAHILRGGSWGSTIEVFYYQGLGYYYYPSFDSRVSYRGHNNPTFTDTDVGFRCVQ